VVGLLVVVVRLVAFENRSLVVCGGRVRVVVLEVVGRCLVLAVCVVCGVHVGELYFAA
jgi:hypothetical protein